MSLFFGSKLQSEELDNSLYSISECYSNKSQLSEEIKNLINLSKINCSRLSRNLILDVIYEVYKMMLIDQLLMTEEDLYILDNFTVFQEEEKICVGFKLLNNEITFSDLSYMNKMLKIINPMIENIIFTCNV